MGSSLIEEDRMINITKKFEITANAEAMAKFEAFLAMLHYNGGHSGIFAMEFDGDGSDSLKVSPKPEKFAAGLEMSGVGADVEIVMTKDMSVGRFFDDSKRYVSVGGKAVREERDESRNGELVENDIKKAMARLWVRSNCRFAAPVGAPPDIIKQEDPKARAWMMLGGDLHEGVGQSHIDIARGAMKHAEKGEAYKQDLLKDPPMGRAHSNATKMGLWFNRDKALTPPFARAIEQAYSKGMIRPDGVLIYLDGTRESLEQYQEALRQAGFDLAELAAVPEREPTSPMILQAPPASPAL